MVCFPFLYHLQGLGKTIQSTSFLNHLYYTLNVTGPFLIVTPLSTIGNWEREIRTWTDMNVVVYHGRDVARNLIIETEFYYRDSAGKPLPDIYKFDIVLTVSV
jgi:SNF2 family DNA or RNA helicase